VSQESRSESTGDDPVRLLKRAKSAQDKAELVVTALADKLARALATIAEDIVPTKRLADYGVDSPMAVELRNWIAAAFNSSVAVFDIMGARSITEVGKIVVSKSELASSPAQADEKDLSGYLPLGCLGKYSGCPILHPINGRLTFTPNQVVYLDTTHRWSSYPNLISVRKAL
jgi:hypothetical protein